ncbi:MAG: sensor histidine kinase [Rhizomicrobium sp.]
MNSSFTAAVECSMLLNTACVIPVPEREVQILLKHKDVLLQEMQHRVGNSLQIVASILLMSARTTQSEEARLHLRDAHGRIMSIAAVQKQLQASQTGEPVEIGPYLSALCESLEASLVDEAQPVRLDVQAEAGVLSAHEAVSIGLMATELVINALKHAFGPDDADCRIGILFESRAGAWRVSVRDNGCGSAAASDEKPKFGLGTSIVEALARQLGARVAVVKDTSGYSTAITHNAFI